MHNRSTAPAGPTASSEPAPPLSARSGWRPSPPPMEASGSVFELAACKALEMAGLAIVLVDVRGRVHQFNSVAKSRLRTGPLKLVGGLLAGTNELDTRRLHDAIRWAGQAQTLETRGVPLSARWSGAVYQVTVAPLDLQSAEPGVAPLALVILPGDADAAHQAEPRAPLTDAEIRLLRGLTGGERLKDYASRTGVKLSTVKTHLQSLFDKFGERRQTDLVRRALSDPSLRRLLTQAPDAE